VAHNSAPNIAVYTITAGPTFTKQSDPASAPSAGNGRGCKFNDQGTALALATTSTPFIHQWAVSGTTVGTKTSNPATLPAGQLNTVAYNTSGSLLAVGGTTAPRLAFYTTGGGTLTKQSDPATLPTDTVNMVDFN
jgi:hypothetical protein